MSDANTKHLRAARARVRGAITMLRQAVNLARMSAGVESMSEATTEEMLRIGRHLEGCVTDLKFSTRDLDACEREANAHVAAWNKKRRAK